MGGSRSASPLKDRGSTALTPSDQAQFYMDGKNTCLHPPKLIGAEYQVVQGSAAVVLQRRLECIAAERAASKEYADVQYEDK